MASQPIFSFTFNVSRSESREIDPAIESRRHDAHPSIATERPELGVSESLTLFRFRPPSPRPPRVTERTAAQVSVEKEPHALSAGHSAMSADAHTPLSENAPDAADIVSTQLKMENIDIGHDSNSGSAKETSLDAPPPSLQLKSLNVDVLEQIYSWLDGESLGMLMSTCRYFSEAALPALCKRAGRPLMSYWHLLSFHEFLRRRSPISRPGLILRLHIALPRHELGQDIEGYDAFGFAMSRPATIAEVLLDVLHLCRNLRYLNLNMQYIRIKSGLLCKTISQMPLLKELWTPLPENMRAQDYRRLARPPLHTLAFSSGGPQSLDDLGRLSTSLVNLRIPDIEEWHALQTNAVFPQVQRLEIGSPCTTQVGFAVEVKRVFPNLRYLTLAATATGRRCILDDNASAVLPTIENQREYNLRQRLANPQTWPELAYFAYRHPCAAYAVALPSHVTSLSVTVDVQCGLTPHERLSRTIIADTKPTCLELRMSLSRFKKCFQSADNIEEDASEKPFSVLPTDTHSWSLLRCILTVEADLNYPSGMSRQPYLKNESVMLGVLERQLTRLSLTHLLMKYGHFCANRATRRYCVKDSLVVMDPRRRLSQETALRLANASRTLRWIGIYVESVGLRSWEIVRLQEDGESDGRVVLEEMSEDRSRGVLATEQMEELALGFHPFS
ncbi:hypothetical protein OH77DRAFT_923492 [Trametes cingulata]|nr:hypothetical protein OH77DRAFT_923492 [Trametes cingulata]